MKNLDKQPSLSDDQYIACVSEDDKTYHAVFSDSELWESQYFFVFDLEEVRQQIENYVRDGINEGWSIAPYWGILHMNTGKIVERYKHGLHQIKEDS